ncbi:MAG: polyphenol oxidase family protein, partial [Gammaproteobacteria bacterium]
MGWIKADWPAPDWIHAGTTTRPGGISKPPYDEFNLAQHVGDDQKNVSYNRDLLRQQLELPVHPDWLKQEHDNRIINLQNAHGKESADGSYTKQANYVCAVLTADCLPLLLCDKQGTQIATIHVGWRGLCKNIVARALELFSAERHQLMAWLGPCISATHYDVGLDVFEACTKILED